MVKEHLVVVEITVPDNAVCRSFIVVVEEIVESRNEHCRCGLRKCSVQSLDWCFMCELVGDSDFLADNGPALYVRDGW